LQKTSRPKKKWFGKQKLQTSASQSETDKAAPPLPPPEVILPHSEIETSHDRVKVATAVVVEEPVPAVHTEPVPAVQTEPVEVQATTIVQLHSKPTEGVAAIRIQKAFRGYLVYFAIFHLNRCNLFHSASLFPLSVECLYFCLQLLVRKPQLQ